MGAKKIIFIIICHLSFCSCASNNLSYSNSSAQNRVKEIAKEITKDYQGKDPVLVGVLRGVVVFMADLMPVSYTHLTLPTTPYV